MNTMRPEGAPQPPGKESAPAGSLEEFRSRYHDIVHRNLAGIFRTTLDGRILECNDAMARILGFRDHHDLLAASALDLYHSQEDRRRYLEQLMERKELINFEIRLKHRSGGDVHVLENVFLDDAPGRTPTVLGMFVDITAFKRAEAEQRALTNSYRDLVEHMHDGLIVTVDGIVRYANPAAVEMLDDQLVDSSLGGHFQKEDRPLLEGDSWNGGRGEEPLRLRSERRREREFLVRRIRTIHNGARAIQYTLQDHTLQQHLVRERIRLQLAEEVNQVLREEIAGHRRTQEQLQRAKRFARNLIDSSLDMIMAGDESGLITEYNPAASLRFGYEQHEVLGKDTRILYANPAEYERVQREMEAHGAFAGEVRNRDKFGNEFISYLAASKLMDEEGRHVGAMGVSRDITRMKRDQEALRQSEERYRDLFENATDLIQSVNRDGAFEYVNNAWKSALGYSAEELDRLTIWDVLHPDHAQECHRVFAQVMNGQDVGVFRTTFRAKDGRAVSVEGTANLRMLDGVPQATRSIFRDITHVLVARKQVQEHEAKLRALFESSEHMFWTIDPGLRLTSFNRGYGDMIERLHGVRPEINQDPSRPRKRFASDAYHDFWEEKYKQAFAGRAARFETDLIDQEGRRVCNEVFLSPVFDAEGRVTEVFGVGHEITEQKEAEDQVREHAARLLAIFESSANMMIWTLDNDLRITSCNVHFQRSIEQVHGIAFAVGDPFAERMAMRVKEGSAKALLTRYANALRGKPQQFEVELVDLQGKPAWVENFLNPIIVDGKVREISCLAYGITDRKQAQRELEQSLTEKEVLLKEVHHRVKNNLQVISSITKLQSERTELDPKVIEVLHHSRDRIRSMALIHDSLYQTKQFSQIDLAEYIDGLARNLMLSYSTSERITLDLRLTPVRLNIDQAMPCGLILNEIISNALKHGYPDGRTGTLSIDLGLQEDLVSIRVSDDGIGLREAFAEERDGHLGLELIRLLTSQLDGRMQRTSGSGVVYLLTFERLKTNAYAADERSRSGG